MAHRRYGAERLGVVLGARPAVQSRPEAGLKADSGLVADSGPGRPELGGAPAGIDQAHRPRGRRRLWDGPRGELQLAADAHAGDLLLLRAVQRGPPRGREPLRAEGVEGLARPARQAEVARIEVVRAADSAALAAGQGLDCEAGAAGSAC